MTHATAIRLLTTIADMLDNERTLAEWRSTMTTLQLTQNMAERFASACEHAAEVLATLPEEPEEPEEEARALRHIRERMRAQEVEE